MANYVDAFVLPVPTKNLTKYKKLAALAAKVWTDHGALEYVEAVAEDLAPGFGVPFAKMAKAKKGETVVVSWIKYKSRAQRDKVNALVSADKRMAGMAKSLPFDVKRMAWGGFDTLVAK